MRPTSATINHGGFSQAQIRNIPGVEAGCERGQANNSTFLFPHIGGFRGFALVATLSLMILLTLVAVGLLSLATISMRTSSQAKAEADARANARMALMFAIGELQKHTGSDTRITASAEFVEPGAPPLTGVWRSWEGTDHDGTRRSNKPDYTVKTKAESNNG